MTTEKSQGTFAAPLFDGIAIIGLGLIGASLCRVARQQKLAGTIIGADTDPAVCARANQIELVDRMAESVEDAVEGCGLVILCTPVGAMAGIASVIGPRLAEGAILSDVGSTKASVIEAVRPHLPPHVHFIPAHPVAGTEYSGPDAGFSTLFVNRWAILTPPEGTDREALSRYVAFWELAGANVEVMSAAHHDIVLAITSHVPHLIAYNIVRTASDLERVTEAEVMKFSAGGFRDFTRIAASDPTMWRDVFLNNRDAVLDVLGRFNEDLSSLQRMVRDGDGQGLFDLFTRTRAIRRGIIAQGQETEAADFGRRKSEERL